MIFSLALGGVLISTFASAGYADEAQLMSLIRDLQKQMEQMQKTMDWQGEKLKELQRPGSEGKAVPAEIKEGLKREIVSYDWLKGFEWKGDFRLRYDAQQFASGALTESQDRNRFRFRLRFGFEKEFRDELKIGARLASGAGTDVTSTNQTFDSNFSGKEINIDQAWAEYKPGWADWGPVRELKFVGGKFENPMKKRSTFLVWDSDVNPEGAYEEIQSRIITSDPFDARLSAVLGQWILEESNAGRNDSAELYVYSGGLHLTPHVRGFENLAVNSYFNFYDYADFALPGNHSAANNNLTLPVSQGGPAYLASAFHVWETYHEIDFRIEPFPKIKAWGQFAHNLNEGAPDNRAPGQNDLWGFGGQIGETKKKGTWELSYAYGHAEVHAVPDGFNDADFGHGDTRGSVIRGGYALTDYLHLNLAAIFTNAISAENQRIDQERRIFQVDLIWKF